MATNYPTLTGVCTGIDPGTGLSEFYGRFISSGVTHASGNYTTLTWRFEIYINRTAYQSGFRYQSRVSVGVTIDGQSVFFNSNYGNTIQAIAMSGRYSSSPLVLCSGTTDIQHDTDGRKNVAINANITIGDAPGATPNYLQSITAAGTITLDSITRGAIIDSCPDITLSVADTSSHTVTWDDVRDYYYKVQYLCGNTILHTSSAISPNTETYTWSNIPASIAQYWTTSRYMPVTVALHTYSDSACTNEMGVSSKTFTVSLAAFQPTISSPTVQWSNAVGSSPVAGLSSALVSWMTAYWDNVSIASGYAVYVDSSNKEVGDRVYFTEDHDSSNPISLSPLPSFNDTSKTYQVKVSVTDTRGLSSSGKSASITVYGWASPAISAVSAFRCNSDETPNLSGGYYDVSFTYSIRSLNSQNAKNAKISYKYASDNSWTQSASGAVSNYSGTLSMGPYTLSQARDEKLEIKVELWDSLSSDNHTTITLTILPAEVFLDMITNDDDVSIHEGLGIGRTNTERFTVQSAWPLKIYDDDGNVRITLDYTNGLCFYDDTETLTAQYPVTGISPGGGGAYNITSVNNGDGTQSLSITDA